MAAIHTHRRALLASAAPVIARPPEAVFAWLEAEAGTDLRNRETGQVIGSHNFPYQASGWPTGNRGQWRLDAGFSGLLPQLPLGDTDQLTVITQVVFDSLDNLQIVAEQTTNYNNATAFINYYGPVGFGPSGGSTLNTQLHTAGGYASGYCAVPPGGGQLDFVGILNRADPAAPATAMLNGQLGQMATLGSVGMGNLVTQDEYLGARAGQDYPVRGYLRRRLYLKQALTPAQAAAWVAYLNYLDSH